MNEIKHKTESLIDIHISNMEDEKIEYIKTCDEGFTVSICKRNNFKELFDKINDKALFFAAKLEGEIAGYAVMYCNDFDGKQAYITLFGVKVEYQRQYIGTILMTECIRYARAQGMECIRLEVLNQDESVIRFYESCGFEMEGVASDISMYMINRFEGKENR